MANRDQSAQVNLSQALTDSATDKRLSILRGVAATGSISKSARLVGVSYKSAWQAIETLTNLAGTALVEKVIGGTGGGGARLTQAGEDLLIAAEQWLRLQRNWFDRLSAGKVLDQAALFHPAGLTPLGLAMQTSMRNQWPVTVKSCEEGHNRIRVALMLVDGQQLWAQITAESQQLLDLKPGVPALAMCKANAVSIGNYQSVKRSGGFEIEANMLNGFLNPGQDLEKLSRGDPVSVTLASDVSLLGYWQSMDDTDSNWMGDVSTAVAVQIDERAVVIAR
ncbi:MAG: TOBE domain-containing protein [Orrella sp.]